MSALQYVLVFVGAGLGGAVRLWVGHLIALLADTAFPVGTLAINIVGSCVMGLLTAYFTLSGAASQDVRLFLTTGVLGGFTTFSTFSLDAVTLGERGEWAAAGAYVTLSLFLSIAGLIAGMAIARLLSPGTPG